MMTSQVTEDVTEFATAVRASLSDLRDDEVEELTEGLEADLGEQSREWEQSPYVSLGDPAAYALELRTAAGLSPAPTTTRATGGRRLRETGRVLAGKWSRGVAEVRKSPAGAAALDFLVALRPAWWILRGWVAYEVVHYAWESGYGSVLPSTFRGWVVLLLLVVVSVQWGRGAWLSRDWMRHVVVAVSVGAVLLLPLALDQSQRGDYFDQYGSFGWSPDPDPAGLAVGGRRVHNVFAYDAEGRPLVDVQLFDERGRPLDVSARRSEGSDLVSATSTTGRPMWNAFPLRLVARADTHYDPGTGRRVPDEDASPQDATLPLATVPALAGSEPEAEEGSTSDAAPDRER